MIPEDKAIFVKKVTHLDNYRLRIEFSDGHSSTVDFESFLKNAQNPSISKYLDPELFSQYEIEEGDLQWNDYELCFPVEDLYENKNIERKDVNAA